MTMGPVIKTTVIAASPQGDKRDIDDAFPPKVLTNNLP
jgi:hypothetical protein